MALSDFITRVRSKVIDQVVPFALETATYMYQQAAALPTVVSERTIHPWLHHVGRILYEDVAPFVAVKYGHLLAQDYLEDQDHPAATALQWGLYAAATAYTTCKFIQFTFHTTGLTMLTGKALRTIDSPNNRDYQQLCVDHKCSTIVGINNDLSDFIAYMLTEGALKGIYLIPYCGALTAQVIAGAGSAYNTGRYGFETSKPGCTMTLIENMQQNQAVPLAIGLMHALLTAASVATIQALTRLPGYSYRNFIDPNSSLDTEIPAHYYAAMVGQLCLVVELLFAAKMVFPKPVDKATKGAIDPLIAYQGIIQFLVNTFLQGLKKTLPPLIKKIKNTQITPWMKLEDASITLWSNPRSLLPTQIATILALPVWQKAWLRYCLALIPLGTTQFLHLTVPKILYDKNALFQDPILGKSLENLRLDLIEIIYFIENIKKSTLNRWLIDLASKDPETAAEVGAYLLGWPVLIIELIIKARNHPPFMQKLRNLRSLLEGDQVLTLPALTPEAQAFLLNFKKAYAETAEHEEPEEDGFLIIAPSPTEAVLSVKEAKQLINHVANSTDTTQSARELIRGDSIRRANAGDSPSSLILGRRQNALFQDPQQLLQRRPLVPANQQTLVDELRDAYTA